MNKTLIVILVIILLAILGFGIYRLMSSPALPPSTTVPMAAGTGGETGFTTSSATTTAQ